MNLYFPFRNLEDILPLSKAFSHNLFQEDLFLLLPQMYFKIIFNKMKYYYNSSKYYNIYSPGKLRLEHTFKIGSHCFFLTILFYNSLFYLQHSWSVQSHSTFIIPSPFSSVKERIVSTHWNRIMELTMLFSGLCWSLCTFLVNIAGKKSCQTLFCQNFPIYHNKFRQVLEKELGDVERKDKHENEREKRLDGCMFQWNY